MTQDVYSIPQLVADLKRIRAEGADEHRILAEVRPLALRAAESSDLWLERAHVHARTSEQGFSLFPLNEEEDHSLAVFAFSWLPDRGTPPHDHGTWAVVAGVVGAEWNTFWRRQDDGTRPGYAKLDADRRQDVPAGRGAGDAERHDPPGVESDRGGHGFAPYLRHAHQPHRSLAVRREERNGATFVARVAT